MNLKLKKEGKTEVYINISRMYGNSTILNANISVGSESDLINKVVKLCKKEGINEPVHVRACNIGVPENASMFKVDLTANQSIGTPPQIVDYKKLLKQDLIEFAHSKGLKHIKGEEWTKKDIINALDVYFEELKEEE